MNVYLHDKNDLKKNIIKYIICLLSLYLYGFYKNGILLYSKDYVSFLEMFKSTPIIHNETINEEPP